MHYMMQCNYVDVNIKTLNCIYNLWWLRLQSKQCVLLLGYDAARWLKPQYKVVHYSEWLMSYQGSRSYDSLWIYKTWGQEQHEQGDLK